MNPPARLLSALLLAGTTAVAVPAQVWTDALVGAALGGVAGGIIGNNSDGTETWEGAAAGAGIGALVGGTAGLLAQRSDSRQTQLPHGSHPGYDGWSHGYPPGGTAPAATVQPARFGHAGYATGSDWGGYSRLGAGWGWSSAWDHHGGFGYGHVPPLGWDDWHTDWSTRYPGWRGHAWHGAGSWYPGACADPYACSGYDGGRTGFGHVGYGAGAAPAGSSTRGGLFGGGVNPGLTGAILGAIAGGIIGNNSSGSDTWEGAAIGAAAGYILGDVVGDARAGREARRPSYAPPPGAAWGSPGPAVIVLPGGGNAGAGAPAAAGPRGTSLFGPGGSLPSAWYPGGPDPAEAARLRESSMAPANALFGR